MAESVLEDVRKLQSRLTSASEPKKLLKSLKRLSELPMTIDILQETGVGKSVNSLRKHEQVGIFAKNLVAIWKKLLPVSQEKVRHNLEPTEQDRNLSRKRHRDLLPKEGCSETHQPSCSQSYELDCGTKKVKRCSEPEKSHQEVSYGIPQDRSWRRGSSDQECSDYGHAVSSELSESPQELYMDLCRAEEQEKEQKSFSQKGMKSPPFQDPPEVTHHRHFSDSQEKPSTSQSKEPKSSHKERQRPEAKGEDKASVFSSERLPKASSSFHEASLPGSSKEKLKAPDSLKREKKKDGASSSGIKRQKTHFDLEDSLNEHRKKQKTHDLEKAKAEKIKFSLETICVDQEKPKPEGDFPHKNKEKKSSSSFKTSEAKPKVFESHKRPAGFSLPREGEVEDEYEQPTMSFESYLSYDQPQKKKRKLAKPTTAPAPEKAHSSKQNGSKSSAKSSDASRKAPKPPSEKKLVEASAPKTKKILIDVLPMLPDIPLPPIQANYRPLPSLETIPFVQPKRKALSSPTAEDEAGFTGRRLNSKMQVYSGSKTAYLPKMMTLHEQCIRVLSNNIDSIYEVGGVPYSVLEPVLERCTPEQLYRIEECNHVLTEDTDQLWHNHCQRDFKKEKPDEFESWREMYLRLHDAREQRLLMLTQNIRSAHANKPKARVAKMAFVNSTVKPPREVRRRQEKFGTGGAAAPEKIKIKPVLFTATKSSSVHAEEEQDYDRPSTSSGLSCSSMGSTSSVSYDPRKPQVKKIAPMMAKTIKAFKNRFSRR